MGEGKSGGEQYDVHVKVYEDRKFKGDKRENKNHLAKLVKETCYDTWNSFWAVKGWPERYLTGENKDNLDRFIDNIVQYLGHSRYADDSSYTYDVLTRCPDKYLTDENILNKLIDSLIKDHRRLCWIIKEYGEKYLIKIIDRFEQTKDKKIIVDFLLNVLPKDKLSLVPDSMFETLLEGENLRQIFTEVGFFKKTTIEPEWIAQFRTRGRTDIVEKLREVAEKMKNSFSGNKGGLSLADIGNNGELSLVDDESKKGQVD
ncbi:MAG: hypothetical protein COX80_02035 [Candidatus Magasanikbacteria bacterium CG_4_10_14_0_2_um_filter_33_14]|uniref:Uncharacterized protein n=1 Tax=Candidatus Magasanikbacteria bacterium CG_4_10_14_0_2_um_filter_33_14 TaxID=1974636 RepID=A0A2M7VB56_9BACT|nr:MAG: hypothetical protein COX80_02035 [Candidatus Magasanikbacteria bacterium CG_4_10_14_0_2_um_filter_33_14]